LCFVCLNRVAPGLIQHTAHGLVVVGEYRRPAAGRTHALSSWFRQAGVPCQVTENLEQAHWEKLVWNIPFNGLGVAGSAGYEAVRSGTVLGNALPGPTLATDRLLGEPRWEQLVRELMGEVIATARRLGFNLDPALAEENLRRTRTMGAYKASTLLDFERQQPLELEGLFLEPLRYAQRAGVPTPRLQTLAAVLQQLDNRHTPPGTNSAFP
jgi:2-dehydropantoate 2-reductase